MINAGGAAGECALHGYYQPAAALIRDMLEIVQLLDLFRHDRQELAAWRVADDRELKSRFQAFHVRQKLEKFDEANAGYRRDAYAAFSAHGTHLHPRAINLISPDGDTMVGPFPDEVRVVQITYDIARYLGAGSALLAMLISTGDIKDEYGREQFFEAKTLHPKLMAAWQKGVGPVVRQEGLA